MTWSGHGVELELDNSRDLAWAECGDQRYRGWREREREISYRDTINLRPVIRITISITQQIRPEIVTSKEYLFWIMILTFEYKILIVLCSHLSIVWTQKGL